MKKVVISAGAVSQASAVMDVQIRLYRDKLLIANKMMGCKMKKVVISAGAVSQALAAMDVQIRLHRDQLARFNFLGHVGTAAEVAKELAACERSRDELFIAAGCPE